MRILISNDDGIYSPGIAALAEAATEFGDVRVVAPDVEQSSASHAITASRPLRTAARHLRRHRGVPRERHAGRLRRARRAPLGRRRRRALRHQPRPQPRQRDLALGHARRREAGGAARDPRFRAQHAGQGRGGRLRRASSRGSSAVLASSLPRRHLPALVNVNFPLEPRGMRWTRIASTSTTARSSPARIRWAASSTGSPSCPLEDTGKEPTAGPSSRASSRLTPLRLDLTDQQELARIDSARPRKPGTSPPRECARGATSAARRRARP